jgi:hemerythrin-like metal-binding protein
MAFFDWNDKLSVGSELIDGQHKALFDTINELYEAMKKGRGRDIMSEILSRFRDYTANHFRDEESYLERYDYPDIGKHKKLHKSFEDKILEFEKELTDGKLLLSLQVMSFLRDWLVDHIGDVDRRYAEFFMEKGIKIS